MFIKSDKGSSEPIEFISPAVVPTVLSTMVAKAIPIAFVAAYKYSFAFDCLAQAKSFKTFILLIADVPAAFANFLSSSVTGSA